MRTNVRRPLFLVLGIVLALTGLFLPEGWYRALPQPVGASSAVSGVFLLKVCFLLEGIVLLALWGGRIRYQPLSPGDRALTDPADAGSALQETFSRQRSQQLLVAITALGIVLRVIGLNSCLWLDEITPVLDYARMPAWKVFGSYFSTNNHLLYTLLMKASTAAFGEQNWAVRLPAALFGMATPPVLYWVARRARLGRGTSLAAAFLLAVSYHHVFFSQNARGYSAHLLFSLAATGFLFQGLRRGRLSDWAGYAVLMLLNVAALLTSSWVLIGHVVVAALALGGVWHRTGRLPLALGKRLAAVFAATGFACFHLYAVIVPQAMATMGATYTMASAGYASPLSPEFVREVLRGVSAGFGTGAVAAAAPFLLVSLVVLGNGFACLVRRNWVIGLGLTLPGVLCAAFLVIRGYVASPRFFLLFLPVALLAGTAGVESVAGWLASRWPRSRAVVVRAATALAVAVGCASLGSLRTYYAVPKQDYSGSLAFVHAVRGPGDAVISLYLAEMGCRYYAPRFALTEGTDLFYVRSLTAFDAVTAKRGADHTLVVTTFPRALGIDHPELVARLEAGWRIARRFRGTIGDGDIVVWVPLSGAVEPVSVLTSRPGVPGGEAAVPGGLP